MNDRGLHQVCKLIELYRNFFGSGSSSQKTGEANMHIMTKMLVEINESLMAESQLQA